MLQASPPRVCSRAPHGAAGEQAETVARTGSDEGGRSGRSEQERGRGKRRGGRGRKGRGSTKQGGRWWS
eukprot:60297-Hanusia_phi.AAC.1